MVSDSDSPTLEQLIHLGSTISTLLTQPDSLLARLDQVAQSLLATFSDSRIYIWAFETQSNFLELQAIAGKHQQLNYFASQIPLGISLIGRIAQTGQPYLSNDVAQDICINLTPEVLEPHLKAFVGYPLLVGDRLVGVMALLLPCPLTTHIQLALQGVAACIALAIEAARTQEELLDRREVLLFRLANQIRNSLDIDTILDVAVHEIRQLLGIDRCHFLWCWTTPEADPTAATPQALLAITHEDKREELPSLIGECSAEQLTILWPYIANFQILQVEDLEQETSIDANLKALLLEWGMTAQLLLPVETRSGQMGAIVCSQSRGPRVWRDNEIQLLQAVTTQLAIAIDQAELYAQTRAAATAAQTQAQQLSEALGYLRKTQSQLIQSEKMSSLGQLVAGIAHEINNPVNFISGNLTHASDYFQDLHHLIELYQEYYPDPVPELQAYAEEIDLEFLLEDLSKLLNSMHVGTERIRQIVLSLRNFSRLDEAEVKPVNLHDGIDSTLLILQGRLKAKGPWSGIEIRKCYGDLPLIECYASQLNQVFMNILSNAIDALIDRPDPRIITITTDVALADADPTTKVAKITIADNGPGIPENVRQQIFDPFFTTKPVGQGTGLGLSICYQIVVEKHHGWINCTSTLGEGTTFTIEIPVRRS
ncbi:ATP-binding protein [Trichothermofontia sp.]